MRKMSRGQSRELLSTLTLDPVSRIRSSRLFQVLSLVNIGFNRDLQVAALELRVMPTSNRSPCVVPYGADQTVYVVLDRCSVRGGACREIEIERSDLETILTDLLAGQFHDPASVVAFNTLEHWSQDISIEVAEEIRTRCDIDGTSVPEHVRDFVESYTVPTTRSTSVVARSDQAHFAFC
jgi:hypothetical protein